MMSCDDYFLPFIMIFYQVHQSECCDEDIMVVHTGDRIVNKEIIVLLSCPAIYFNQGQEKTPYKYTFFTSGYFNRLPAIIAFHEKRNGNKSLLWVVMRIEQEIIFRIVRFQFLHDVQFIQLAMILVQTAGNYIQFYVFIVPYK